MDFLFIVWDDGDGGNVEHLDEHDLTKHDVEFVLRSASKEVTSQSTGRPCVFGYTQDDEFIMVVYEWIDGDTIVPITAYQVPEPTI